MLYFEWDDVKNQRNIEKHGIDFDDAIAVFVGVTVVRVNDKFYGDEIRQIALGEADGDVLAIIFTMRGDVCRIISARKASRHERRTYRAAHTGRTQER